MNIVLAITGASGSIYAKRFIEKVSLLNVNLYVILTNTGKEVFLQETKITIEGFISDLKAKKIEIINNNDFHFKYASGSNKLDSLIILPSSMGSIGRIAHGLSIDLIGRIADVQLKERRGLIICPRETPYSTLHLKNMLALSEYGAIIAPASPSFYCNNQDIDDVIDNYIDRIIELSKIKEMSKKYKW